jgi:hypothetical protein
LLRGQEATGRGWPGSLSPLTRGRWVCRSVWSFASHSPRSSVRGCGSWPVWVGQGGRLEWPPASPASPASGYKNVTLKKRNLYLIFVIFNDFCLFFYFHIPYLKILRVWYDCCIPRKCLTHIELYLNEHMVSDNFLWTK